MKNNYSVARLLFFVFFLWRFLLFFPPLIGSYIISYRNGYEYTSLWRYIEPYFPVSLPFLSAWANFDGIYYLSIAGGGYTRDMAGFFPLYPIAIYIVSQVFEIQTTYGIGQFFTAIFLSNFFFFLSIIVLYLLLRLDYSRKISLSSIFFLLIFPTSFYFVSIYTESMFLFLTVLSFYYARKKNWLLAGISGALLSATRIVGIAILPALVVSFWLSNKEKKLSLIKSWPLFLIPTGVLGYVLYNAKQWGNPLQFLLAHGTLGNSRSTEEIILFPQTVVRYIKILFTVSPLQYEWFVALLEFSFFFWAVGLFYLAWKKKIYVPYLVFSVICFLIPISSGTFSGLPRYLCTIFPFFIVIAQIKNSFVRLCWAIVSVLLLFLLTLLFSRGYFVS